MLTPPTIDSLMSSSTQGRRKCIAVNKRGLPCGNPIAPENVKDALLSLKNGYTAHRGTSEERTELVWLAGLLLCRQSHQGHRHEISQIWQSQARHRSAHEIPAGGRAPNDKRHGHDEGLDKSIANASDRKKQTAEDGHQSKPAIKTNVQTRSMTARASCRHSGNIGSTSEFVDFRKTRRHLPAINADVFKIILNQSKPNKRLSKRDMETGYIYAFTRASSPGYVKIGLTTRAVHKRLDEWERKCYYTPHQETHGEERRIPYVYQVERLILAELALHRRKESVCNDGAGCYTAHHEWVEVGVDLALEVIDRWCSWAEKRPYDDNGVLREEWKAHTKVSVRAASVDEQEQGDRWQEWMDSLPQTSPVRLANESLPTPTNRQLQLTRRDKHVEDKRPIKLTSTRPHSNMQSVKPWSCKPQAFVSTVHETDSFASSALFTHSCIVTEV
ncbi:MAG: hypothetical protein M1830_001551 [Pleopsidium flavum]|nr:MAG: hypothetical protein M1830_001551 [Pleopsidium flavum]